MCVPGTFLISNRSCLTYLLRLPNDINQDFANDSFAKYHVLLLELMRNNLCNNSYTTSG